MRTSLALSPRLFSPLCAALILGLGGASAAHAAAARKNPSSKVYISDVNGDASIDTGDQIQDLAKRSVYTAEGTIIETKSAEKAAEDRSRAYSTMVYSNGTGAFFDADTRVEVKKFMQEPFTPNRSDTDTEPSISQTQAYVARGTVGLCTSKLVAGSSMNYQTPFGSVNINGRKVVIEANKDATVISMLEGDSTVRAGAKDLGGHAIHAGQQAVIRPGASGMPNSIEIQDIPPSQTKGLDDKVSMACLAKKTVYFETKEVTNFSAAGLVASKGSAATGSGSDSAPDAVTAFDGTPVNAGSNSLATGTHQEIIAVPVVPVNLPTEYRSTARLVTPPK